MLASDSIVQRPTEGTLIDIVSGYWERGYSCGVDGFVAKLKEADWLFTDSVRYTDGCDTIGGTSGSPIIEEERIKLLRSTTRQMNRVLAVQ